MTDEQRAQLEQLRRRIRAHIRQDVRARGLRGQEARDLMRRAEVAAWKQLAGA